MMDKGKEESIIDEDIEESVTDLIINLPKSSSLKLINETENYLESYYQDNKKDKIEHFYRINNSINHTL